MRVVTAVTGHLTSTYQLNNNANVDPQSIANDPTLRSHTEPNAKSNEVARIICSNILHYALSDVGVSHLLTLVTTLVT